MVGSINSIPFLQLFAGMLWMTAAPREIKYKLSTFNYNYICSTISIYIYKTGTGTHRAGFYYKYSPQKTKTHREDVSKV